MAKFVVCAVYDAAVKAFATPFFVRSKGEAVRSFGDACTDPKIELGKHPDDFTLHYIGNWDDAGYLDVLKDAELLAKAVDYAQRAVVLSPHDHVRGS